MTAPGTVRTGPATRADWQTPPEVFVPLLGEFFFNIDAAASAANHLVERYVTEEDDALNYRFWQPSDIWWCNPPYGAGMLDWVQAFHRWARDGRPGVALVPANTEVEWFRTALASDYLHEVRLVYPRIQFLADGVAQRNNPGGSALLIYDRRVRPLSQPAFRPWSWKA